MDQYFKVGKLAASHGLKGHLVLQHSLGKKTSLKGLETIFIEEGKDNLMPYFIREAKIKSDEEVYVSLETIETKEQARKLTPKDVWVTADDFKKFASSSSPIAFLGFTLFNENKKLGEILEVIEQPHQLLCTILINNREVLIPVHQESLNKVDKKKKEVHVTLPEGLLDIYLT